MQEENMRQIYNLEFPSWCQELNIFGYRFVRVEKYAERLQCLQHVVAHLAEFNIDMNTGEHTVTAYVELPKNEEDAALEWSGDNNSALMDILLLLSIFTGREVFAGPPIGGEELGVIIRDSRYFFWGGIVRLSIPYEANENNCNQGFEVALEQIYTLIRSNDWQRTYFGGYYLFLARMAFKNIEIEIAFIQCWTIWEHLFSVLNRNEMTKQKILNTRMESKILNIFERFELYIPVDDYLRNGIKRLIRVRNRLIHFGRFPMHEEVHADAILFIHLTEFIVAKSFNLEPSNELNTNERLNEFLQRANADN